MCGFLLVVFVKILFKVVILLGLLGYVKIGFVIFVILILMIVVYWVLLFGFNNIGLFI